MWNIVQLIATKARLCGQVHCGGEFAACQISTSVACNAVLYHRDI
jgi:hypothetical protein